MDGVMVTLRFDEFEYYNILEDAAAITFMAITNTGTFSCNTLTGDSPALIRAKKEEFKKYVFQSIKDGTPPHEVEME